MSKPREDASPKNVKTPDSITPKEESPPVTSRTLFERRMKERYRKSPPSVKLPYQLKEERKKV